MRRRALLQSVASGMGIAAVGGFSGRTLAASTVGKLEFDSSASLVDEFGGGLTDDSRIAVYAESTAGRRSSRTPTRRTPPRATSM